MRVAAFLVLLTALGCASTVTPPMSNRFDPGQIHLGSRIGDLEVVQLQLGRVGWDSDEIVGVVRFGGQATITGTTRPHHDSDIDALCFELDSAETLPRFITDERRPWLCFENDFEARQQLGQPKERRRAKIVVDNFQTVHQYTDAFDTARFVRLVER